MLDDEKKKNIATVYLLLVAIIWGSSYVFSKMVILDIGAGGYVSLRMFIAFVVLSVIFLPRYLHLNAKVWKAALMIAIPQGLSYLCFMIGLEYTSAAKTGFLSVSYIVFTPFLSYFISKIKIEKKEWIGVILACIGLILLTVQEGFFIAPEDSILLLGGFFYGMEIIMIGRYTRHMDVMLLAALQMGIAALIGILYTVIADQAPQLTDFSKKTILLVLYLGIVSTALATAMQNWAQQYVSPTATAIIFVFEPVVGAFCGYWILNEVLSVKQLLGCVVIVVALLWGTLDTLQLRKKKNDADQVTEFS